MARRTTKSRIEIEVKQREAQNRAQFKKIQRWARQTEKVMAGIATAARRIAIGLTGFFAVAIKLYAKQEIAEKKLAGALKATGQEVGRLSKKYKQLAADLQATTTFGDEDLLGAAATLTRLAHISEEQMPRILELTADWAAFLGKDVNSAARDVGRVMADPVRNLSLLGRYGVQVTDELKAGLAALIATGRVEEARLVVWQELHKVVGGAAAELAAVETGKWIQLKNTVGDLMELFGKRIIERLQPLRIWLTDLLAQFTANADQVKRLADLLIRGLMYAISLLVASKFLAYAALAVKAIYSMRTAAGASALAFRALWASATLGLAFLVPFVVENWDKIVRVFDVSIQALRDKVDSLLNFWKNAQATIAGDAKKDNFRFVRGGKSEFFNDKVREIEAGLDELEARNAAGAGPSGGPGLSDDTGWWGKVKAAWSGSDGGLGSDAGGVSGEDSEEARRIASGALTLEELQRITEEYAAAEEGRAENKKEIADKAAAEEKAAEEKKTKLLAKEEAARVLLAADAARSKIKIIQVLYRAKGAIEKIDALRTMAIALARDPTAAFAKTYAQWGFPLGAIFGAIAQAATYAPLISGIASLRSMAQGGRVEGGVQGQDSVLTNLAPGELVGPADSFDEIVESVAASRADDLAGGGGDIQPIVLEVDGHVLAETVVELSRRNRAV